MSDLVGRDKELALIASLLKEVVAEAGRCCSAASRASANRAPGRAEEAAEAAGARVARARAVNRTQVNFSGLAPLLQPLSDEVRPPSTVHGHALAATAIGDAGEPPQDRLIVFQATLACSPRPPARPLLTIVDDLDGSTGRAPVRSASWLAAWPVLSWVPGRIPAGGRELSRAGGRRGTNCGRWTRRPRPAR